MAQETLLSPQNSKILINMQLCRIYSNLALLMLIVGVVIFISSPSQAQTQVNNIRFGTHTKDTTRVVLELSDQNINYRAFTLPSPYRLVIDLQDTTLPSQALPNSQQRLIKEYRHGTLQKDVSRMVFELSQPVAITKTFTLGAQSPNPPRLVIDIKSVTQAEFNTQKNTVFGNQNLLNTAYIAPPQPETQKSGTKTPSPWKKKTIIIDAGHGGNDPGAISKSGIREKNVTLNIAKELQKQLNATGRYNASLTRTGDYYIKLRKRIDIAREKEADLFISIHADSLGKSHVRGASIYTLSETASDTESARLAERENLSDVIAGVELEEENNEVANILIDLAMRDTMNQSKMFANMMVHKMDNKGIRLLANSHRYAGFAVLKAPDIPSVLIETGYLSNEQDAHLLNSAAYQQKLATTIIAAIQQYFEEISYTE